MARLDGHMHIYGEPGNRSRFHNQLRISGLRGGIVISQPPASFPWLSPPVAAARRLKTIIAWCQGHDELYPFFWIDPLEENSLEQVENAFNQGVRGFKVACNRFYPGDPRCMAVLRDISRRRLPVLFHSGILRDGSPSSKYNRPAEFEILLDVPGLRFALAHLGWPWCDEFIAVFGKFQQAALQRLDLNVEMFVDITPGTPPMYRRESLIRLFTVGYDLDERVFFGSNQAVDSYDTDEVGKWMELDQSIYDDLGLSERVQVAIYSHNIRRFLDMNEEESKGGVEKRRNNVSS